MTNKPVATTVFCPVPGGAKPEDKCANPYCSYPMSNHYAFPHSPLSDEDYQRQIKLWDFMKRNSSMPTESKTTEIPKEEQAMIDCLDDLYNYVTQDVRDKFAPTLQSIRNYLAAENRLAVSRKLRERTQALSEIANKRPPFLNGASDHAKGFNEMKAMARKACK